MKKKIILFVSLFVFGCATLFSAGCSGGSNNQDPNQGFKVRVLASGFSTSAQIIQGNFISGAGTSGSLSVVNNVRIEAFGYTPIPNTKVPGTWRLIYGPDSALSLCLGVNGDDRNVSLGSQETLNCVSRFFTFTPSPDTINALSPPPLQLHLMATAEAILVPVEIYTVHQCLLIMMNLEIW